MLVKGKLAFVKGAVALGCAAAAVAGTTGVASASVGQFFYRVDGVPRVLTNAQDGECLSLEGTGTNFGNFTDTTVQVFAGTQCRGPSVYLNPYSGDNGAPPVGYSLRFLN
ncbi:hypothetical protein [Actinomadura gamaensis]|uniref:Uncharacterized protein n=1 Tax=Actinomadura gamaensis TaxID=1763541 RepID=A0ABV9U1P4_9ACTN